MTILGKAARGVPELDAAKQNASRRKKRLQFIPAPVSIHLVGAMTHRRTANPRMTAMACYYPATLPAVHTLELAGIELTRTLGTEDDHAGRWTGLHRGRWVVLSRPSKLAADRTWWLVVWGAGSNPSSAHKRTLEASAATLSELAQAMKACGLA